MEKRWLYVLLVVGLIGVVLVIGETAPAAHQPPTQHMDSALPVVAVAFTSTYPYASYAQGITYSTTPTTVLTVASGNKVKINDIVLENIQTTPAEIFLYRGSGGTTLFSTIYLQPRETKVINLNGLVLGSGETLKVRNYLPSSLVVSVLIDYQNI